MFQEIDFKMRPRTAENLYQQGVALHTVATLQDGDVVVRVMTASYVSPDQVERGLRELAEDDRIHRVLDVVAVG